MHADGLQSHAVDVGDIGRSCGQGELGWGIDGEGARQAQVGLHALAHVVGFVVIATDVDGSGLVAVGLGADWPAHDGGGFCWRHPIARVKCRRGADNLTEINRHRVEASKRSTPLAATPR